MIVLGDDGLELPPLGRPGQGKIAFQEPREGQAFRLLAGQDGALEIGCEEGQPNEAAAVRGVRCGVERGPAVRVARENLVRRAQGRDQNRICLARVRYRGQNFCSAPPGREPQRKLQAQLCGIRRIDSSIFAGGQSRLKSPEKRDVLISTQK
jgi:hypothetical protein